MVKPIENVAVIGAGVSGVASAAYLKAAGLQVTLFERSKISGGVWVFDSRLPPEPAYPSLTPSIAETAFYETAIHETAYEKTNGNVPETNNLDILHAPPGPCYESLSNNVPTGLMKLKLNSWPDGTEQIVRHNILAEYIQDTAAKTGVNEIARYNTKVKHISKIQDHWKVQTSILEAGRLEKGEWEFDAVIIATGHYHVPKVPDIPGLKDWKAKWPSRILHSKRYRNAEGFEGKNILLIGGSTSSFDIAKELVGISKTIYQSTRSGLFDHPTSRLPPGVIRIPEIASFNLIQQSSSTDGDAAIPGTLDLVDGQVLDNIDRVIICTGYHCTFPFLSDYHRDSLSPAEADELALVTDGTQMHNLHKDIFYIPDPTLAFVGVPYYTATFSLFEFQAITVAAVFSGQARLPAEVDMRAEYKRKVEENGYGRSFHSLRGKDVEYANELLGWINPGIIAAGGQPWEGHTKEWKAQYEALREKFKELIGEQPKPHIERQNIGILSTAGGPIEAH